jgi:signal peptidase I
VGLAAAWLLRHWVWMPVFIDGRSMEPTLRNAQFAGVNKLAYQFGSPQRGDVVAVWTGQDLVVKRIVGLPGEEVAARYGILYVNGRPLPERYVHLRGLSEIAPGKLGRDCFLIAGDNRSETFIAVVHRRRIAGRLVVWHSLARSRGSGSLQLRALGRRLFRGQPAGILDTDRQIPALDGVRFGASRRGCVRGHI